MEPRLSLLDNTVMTKFVKYLVSASKVVTDSALPSATQELVKIRASQINGCAFCTDMHTKDALHAGETQLRLNLVAVWREAAVFTESEPRPRHPPAKAISPRTSRAPREAVRQAAVCRR